MLSVERIQEMADKFSSAPQIRGNCPTVLDMAALFDMADAYARAVAAQAKADETRPTSAEGIAARCAVLKILVEKHPDQEESLLPSQETES